MTRTDPPPARPRPSLFRSGLGLRLALAAALVGPLWFAIAWAVSA